MLIRHRMTHNPVTVTPQDTLATAQEKMTAGRFRHLPVQIRVPDLDESECFSTAALATPARERVGKRPFGIDDEAVDRYWLELMP